MAATFPTGLNNFVANDTIESEEWNAIETKIGIDSSAVTTSLDYLLKNSASSNPGHKHTLANGATDITASAAELNILDGATLTVAELNYVDGVTSAIQTQIGGKAATDQTMYIGTTGVAINRGSAALTLAGITLTTPDIGTPSAGTLTSCTGLPLTGLVNDITTALGVGSLELGHATDTTLSRSAAGVLAVEGVVIPSISSINTLTNKRIQPRSSTTTSTATLTPDLATANVWQLTAQAGALTIAAPTGTPVLGEVIHILIKDNATAQAITWNATYKAMGEALKTTTTISKRLEAICVFDGTDWLTSTTNEV